MSLTTEAGNESLFQLQRQLAMHIREVNNTVQPVTSHVRDVTSLITLPNGAKVKSSRNSHPDTPVPRPPKHRNQLDSTSACDYAYFVNVSNSNVFSLMRW